MKPSDLVFEETYPHPPAVVWRAPSREAIAAWLMENDFEPRLGHRFRFRAKPVGGWSPTPWPPVAGGPTLRR